MLRPDQTCPVNDNENQNVNNARPRLAEWAWTYSAWSYSTNRMRSLCVVIVIVFVITAVWLGLYPKCVRVTDSKGTIQHVQRTCPPVLKAHILCGYTFMFLVTLILALYPLLSQGTICWLAQWTSKEKIRLANPFKSKFAKDGDYKSKIWEQKEFFFKSGSRENLISSVGSIPLMTSDLVTSYFKWPLTCVTWRSLRCIDVWCPFQDY